jgi:hypothetical protein
MILTQKTKTYLFYFTLFIIVFSISLTMFLLNYKNMTHDIDKYFYNATLQNITISTHQCYMYVYTCDDVFQNTDDRIDTKEKCVAPICYHTTENSMYNDGCGDFDTDDKCTFNELVFVGSDKIQLSAYYICNQIYNCELDYFIIGKEYEMWIRDFELFFNKSDLTNITLHNYVIFPFCVMALTGALLIFAGILLLIEFINLCITNYKTKTQTKLEFQQCYSHL